MGQQGEVEKRLIANVHPNVGQDASSLSGYMSVFPMIPNITKERIAHPIVFLLLNILAKCIVLSELIAPESRIQEKKVRLQILASYKRQQLRCVR